jgi:hypothetical protein
MHPEANRLLPALTVCSAARAPATAVTHSDTGSRATNLSSIPARTPAQPKRKPGESAATPTYAVCGSRPYPCDRPVTIRDCDRLRMFSYHIPSSMLAPSRSPAKLPDHAKTC